MNHLRRCRVKPKSKRSSLDPNTRAAIPPFSFVNGAKVAFDQQQRANTGSNAVVLANNTGTTNNDIHTSIAQYIIYDNTYTSTISPPFSSNLHHLTTYHGWCNESSF